jgi:hypothetical protein
MVMRLFGAWMLRIDEIIENQRQLIKLLKDSKENKN